MNIIIYDKNTKKDQFVNYGFGKLTLVKKCEITEELNGRFDVELIVSLKDTKLKYVTKWAILMVDNQLFRVVSRLDNDADFTSKIFLKHIFYDINFGFVEDQRAEGVGVKDAMKKALPEDFNFFEVDSDILDTNTLYFVKDNGSNAMLNIIDRWGQGELKRNNFNIGIYKNIGRDNGVTFTYKKIDAIEVLEDTESVVTRLYPTGKDGIALQEKYIYIPNWNDELYPPFHITREINFEGAENEGDLRLLAEKKAKEIGASHVSFSIKVHDLINTELYKNMPDLMAVAVGDTVTVKHNKLNLRLKTKCIKKVKDIVTNKVKLEFGQPFENFFNNIDNSNVKIDIPDTSNLRNELFYYFNGVDIPFKTNKDIQIASMRIATSVQTNLMCYVTINPIIEQSGLLKLRVTINNDEIQFSPLITTHDGYNLLSFTVPFIAVDGGQTHVVKLWADYDGVGTIPANGLHFSITGQNVNMGAIKIEPFTGANISHKFEYDNYEIIDQIVKSNVKLIGYDKTINYKSYAVKHLFDLNNVIGEVPKIFTDNVNVIMRTEEEIQDKYILKGGLYQEDHENIFYMGSWTTETHEKYNNGNGKYSTTTGSSIYFVTNATEFKLYIPSDVNLGSFDVIIDNKYIETISQITDELMVNNNYYSYKFNSTGNHEVKLKVNDTNKTVFDTIEIIE